MAQQKQKLKIKKLLEYLTDTPSATDFYSQAKSMTTPYDRNNSSWRNRSEYIDYYFEPKIWDERTNPNALPKKSNQNKIFSSIMNDRLYAIQRDKLREMLKRLPKLPNIK